MKRLWNETEKLICFPKQAKFEELRFCFTCRIDILFSKKYPVFILKWNNIFLQRIHIKCRLSYYLWCRSLEHNFWIFAILPFWLSCRLLKISQSVNFDSRMCSCGYWELWDILLEKYLLLILACSIKSS